ncbi:hypothetical protein Tco_0434750 [Tanacetum coccineum]
MKLSFVENLIAILPSAELMFLTYALELGLLDGLEVGVESRDIVKLKIYGISGGDGSHILIVWDIENQTPSNFLEEADSLLMAVERKFPGIVVHIKAYGNPEVLGMTRRRNCFQSGSYLVDIPDGEFRNEVNYDRIINADRVIMNEMLSWAMSHPPPAFILLFF